MDISWLYTFIEWISSIITQIPDYYRHAIDILGYGFSDELGYPGGGVFALMFGFSLMFFLSTYIPSVIKKGYLSLGEKFVYLLKGKSLGKESLNIREYIFPILGYLVIVLHNTFSWSLHYLSLKISCTLIVFHTVLFFTCVILENRGSKEQKDIESSSDTILVHAQ